MASGKGSSSSKGRSTSPRRSSAVARRSAKPRYAVCVCNEDYPASLELRKLYPILEDSFAAQHGMVRVIDESGEDYLYPADFFVSIELPAAIEKTLGKIA